MEHDLTRGNVLKTIAVFALPYMLSYFLQMLYGMADLYMMGQFSGAAGITAVGKWRADALYDYRGARGPGHGNDGHRRPRCGFTPV